MGQGLDQNRQTYLGQQRVVAVATVGADGLPHAASFLYRREGADLYVLIDPASSTAVNLGAVGPVAGTIDDVSHPSAWRSLHLRGAAELVADPAESARIAAALATAATASGHQPQPGWQLYRIVADRLNLLEGGAAPGAAPVSREAAELDALRSRLEERQAAPGEEIVRQGQPADRFYVIVAGECEVVREGGGGRQVLARLGPGQFFGETGLLAGVPRTANVVAVGPVRLLTLSRAGFRSALGDTARSAETLAQLIYEGARG